MKIRRFDLMRGRGRALGVAAALCCGLGVWLGWLDRASAAEHRVPAGPPSDLLVASDDDPWTVALAAPAAARLQQTGRSPLVVAISSPPTHEADWLIGLASPRRAILLATSPQKKLGSALERLSPEVLPVGPEPGAASLTVATRFWKRAREIVVAPSDDPEAIILGSSLAAGLAAPLVIREPADSSAAFSRVFQDLGVERILVAASVPAQVPRWAESRRRTVEVLGPQELQHRLVGLLGPANIRNVVVARAPDGRSGAGRSAWLASIVTVAHGAPVVLTHSMSAAAAEADLAQLTDREGLRPCTVTILADYASIGQRDVEIERESPQPAPGSEGSGGTPAAGTPAAPPHYLVKTEPCIPRDLGEVVPVGVGRIPLESLGDASVLFARGLLRERMLAGRPLRLLMVSNAGVVRKPLPLCETISRVTAEEVKNFGIRVDEFYGKLADHPEILTAAKNAGVILYEGHLGYQDLIDVPASHRTTSPDTYFAEELDDLEDDERDRASEPPKHPEEPNGGTGVLPRSVIAAPQVNRLKGPLRGLPIVILQSCDSLDEPTLWRIDELGGVAVIGSVTPIHSGSGSAMLHAAVSAALYRGRTLGEALRDAQNYMFCLEDLKARRGHKEQAKGHRVAVSFRLWGDPELRLFPALGGEPRQSPVTIQWTDPGTLTVRVPAERLPEVRSAKYVAHAFPGSQAAGIVKRREGETLRHLAPVYYFCVSLPEGMPVRRDVSLEPLRGETSQVSARIDPVGRLLYLVYYPEEEKAGQTIALRLVRQRPTVQVGRAAK